MLSSTSNRLHPANLAPSSDKTLLFAGYVTTSGEGWRREYLAWPLVDFKDVDLSIGCEMVPRHLREPILAERISLVADKITFPLKNEYERVNTTLAGIKDIASSGSIALTLTQRERSPDAVIQMRPKLADWTHLIKSLHRCGRILGAAMRLKEYCAHCRM